MASPSRSSQGLGSTAERLLPHRPALGGGEDPRGLVGQQGRDGRVEGAPGPLADHRRGDVVAPEHALEGGVAGDVDDPHGQRDLLAPDAAGLALAVPPLGDVGEQPLHGPGQAEPVGQHGRHLAERGDVALEHPGRGRQPAAICRARTGVGLPESARARRIPAVISACDPNLVGHGVPGQRVVVAEQLGGHVRVGGAAHVEQQAGVVGLGRRLLVDAEPLGQPHRVQGALQAVLEGHVDAEVRRQRERRHHLGGADPFPARGCARHAWTVRESWSPGEGRGVSGPGGASAVARASRRPAGGSCRGPR